MVKDLTKLKALWDLSHAAFEAQQAKLGALMQQRDGLATQLAALDEAARRRHETAGRGGDDPALRAGADMLWQRWIEGRKIAINEARARLEVEIEQMRAETARDFGRSQVARHLHDDARAARNKPSWGD